MPKGLIISKIANVRLYGVFADWLCDTLCTSSQLSCLHLRVKEQFENTSNICMLVGMESVVGPVSTFCSLTICFCTFILEVVCL